MTHPKNDYSSQLGQILDALKKRPTAYLIAIVGIPGSGKSTLCNTLVEKLPNTITLPMDGYHIARSQLSAKDLQRRGAPHTFDHSLLKKDLENLKHKREGSFPSFDHAEKDPKPNAIRIAPDTPMVFVEGNYLLLKDWGLESLFDFTIFINCDLEVAMDRVAQRLHQCAICTSLEEAMLQVQNNDLLNARLILEDGTAERSDLCLG